MTYRFFGRERVTIELEGTFAAPAASALRLPDRLVLDLAGGRGRVALFAFHVEDLAIRGVPLVRASYAEVLWRIAVRDGDTPAWWIAACDLAATAPRLAARRWVRYPTRAVKHLDIDDAAIAMPGLVVRLGRPDGAAPRPEARPIVVGPAAEWEVPWGDDAELAARCAVSVEDDSLGSVTVGDQVTWAGVAAVRHGRYHRCGTASRR